MPSKPTFMKLSVAIILFSLLPLARWQNSYAQFMVQSTATMAATIDSGQTMDQLVDVGGFRLFIHCTGKGSPVVVMDAGGNTPSTTWNKVQPQVSQFTRVCSYDRAGLGKSDPGPTPGTSLLFVKQLHTLLVTARIRGPYVLVGHSFGGMNMRLFASVYPTEVAGMVLVDAGHEDAFAKYFAFTSNGVDYKESGEQVKAAGPFPGIPLLVLRHGRTGDLPVAEDDWLNYQRMLTQLSPQGKLLVAEKSGHFIQNDQPELVIQAIRHVVETVRNGATAPTLTPFWTPIATMAATATP